MDNLILSSVNKAAITEILECNKLTARFGLKLTEQDAKALVQTRAQALKNAGRVEFAGGALAAIITAFADSPFLLADTYMETLHTLVEAFYEYKTETQDTIDDDELIALMRRHFDTTCEGSAEWLREDILRAISRCVRFGEDFENFEGLDDE